jgi:hypothetical protein
VKSILRRRPSPALVISMIALFVSLSGVSYGVATGFIDSREIKNNEIRSLDIRNNQVRTRDLRNNEVRGIDIRNSTVQGRDIALNTVTGEDVKEDTLGKVPSATAADSAASAESVGGVSMRRIAFSDEQAGITPDNFTEILNLGGLTVGARCNAGGILEVQANPTAPNGEFATSFTNGQSDNDFDPGDNRLLVFNADQQLGQVLFAGGDGHVVSIHGYAVQQINDVRGTTDDCGFFGVAEVG